MDPDACLNKIREAIKEVRKNGVQDYLIDDILDGFEDLDKWLSNGGFNPNDWDQNVTHPPDAKDWKSR